jgi:hypothetical protein
LRLALALALAAATAYLSLTTFGPRSDGVVLGNDVLNYADEMLRARGGMLWNPHHLGVHALAAGAYQLLRACGEAADFATAWRAQQIVACLGAATCVYAIVDFVGELAGPARGALVGAVFAVSAGNWLYAASGETYLPGTAACVGLVVLALRMRLGLADAGWIGPALWLCAACVLRQDSVLVVPALVLLLPWRDAWRSVGAAGALCLVLYATAWRAGGAAESFSTWLRGLAESGEWGRAPGLAQFGQTLGLSLAALAWITWEALPLGLACLALLLFPLVPPRALRGEFPRALLALAVWALVRVGFFAWWQPGNLEYHTGNLAPFVLALGVLLRPHAWGGLQSLLRGGWYPLRQLVVLGAAVALLYQSNSAYLLRPHRTEVTAQRLDLAVALAGPGGSVVALDGLTGKALLRARRDGVELIDAGTLAGAPAPDVALPTALAAGRAQLLAHLSDVLARGNGVVASVDWVLPLRLGKPLWNLDSAFLAQLQALGDAQLLKDEEGHVWAVVLRKP